MIDEKQTVTGKSRRHFIKAAIASTAGVTGLITEKIYAIDYNAPVPESKGLTGYLNHGNLYVRLNNMHLLCYRAHSAIKYPYFHPLSGPVTGTSLTTESALPYPHHRGLWLGCSTLNGGDYWGGTALGKGQIRSVQLELSESDESSVTFTDQCHWIRDDAESPLEDQRSFRVRAQDDRTHILDCNFELLARQDIEIKKAKHSLFALRAAPDISPAYGGTLLNAEGGEGAKGTYGKPAKWCTYFGNRKVQPDVVEGIAIMNHPTNFDGDCPWFTRNYGHLSPSPFNFLSEPWRLAEGETLRLKYRVVLYAGTPADVGLDDLYDHWIQHDHDAQASS